MEHLEWTVTNGTVCFEITYEITHFAWLVPDFDAKSRKMRRVAEPVADTDAVKKLYMERSIKLLREQQEE